MTLLACLSSQVLPKCKKRQTPLSGLCHRQVWSTQDRPSCCVWGLIHCVLFSAVVHSDQIAGWYIFAISILSTRARPMLLWFLIICESCFLELPVRLDIVSLFQSPVSQSLFFESELWFLPPGFHPIVYDPWFHIWQELALTLSILQRQLRLFCAGIDCPRCSSQW